MRMFQARGKDSAMPPTLGDRELVLHEKEFSLSAGKLSWIKEDLSIADSREAFLSDPSAFDFLCEFLLEDGVLRSLKYAGLSCLVYVVHADKYIPSLHRFNIAWICMHREGHLFS